MYSPNVKPSQGLPVVALPGAPMAPQAALAAAGNRVSSWLQIPQDAKWLIINLLAGALGGGSEQVDVQQATDNAGTGAKALQVGVIAGANVDNTATDGEVNLESLLDFTNGFAFIQVKVTNTGGTGAFVALRLAFGPSAYMA